VVEGRLVGGVGRVVVEGGPSVHMTMARWFKTGTGAVLSSLGR
jgi:hypothetical protein